MNFFFKKRYLILIIVLTLLVRLLYVLYFPQLAIRGDTKGYDEIAIGLIEQGEFVGWELGWGVIRPPGYPLFLAGVYLLSGQNYLAVRLWHCLFGTLTALFVYLICIRLFKKEFIPLLATALVGLHPALIGYVGLLYTETMFTFFLVVFVYFLQRGIFGGKYFHFSLSGFFLGLVALTSSRIMYFPFLFLILCWFLPQNKKLLIKRWLVMTIFMLLTIAPWTIRNYIVSGKFILLEDYHRAALWFATNPYDIHEWNKEPIKQLIEGKTFVEAEQIMHEEGKRYLKEHPFIYLKNSFKRFFRLWISGHSNIFSGLEKSFLYAWQVKDFKLFAIKFLFLATNLFLLAIGFWGIFLMGKARFTDFLVVFSPIIYSTLLHSFTVAAPRLSVPILPFVLIFSAASIERLLNEVTFKKWRAHWLILVKRQKFIQM